MPSSFHTPSADSSSRDRDRSIRRPRPQISLGFMMLMMLIFALISAGILYASRVDAVQEEINLLVKGTPTSAGGEKSGRLPHLVFIMFTFTSPLLLAGVLSSGLTLLRWLKR